MLEAYFDHEKLKVYRSAISFVAWCYKTLQDRNLKAPLSSQLDRAASSVALNIAEGNGRGSPRDRCRFFEIARGSALECAACLDVLVARESLSKSHVEPGKNMLREIVMMLTGLIASVRSRVAEEDSSYDLIPRGDDGQEKETEQE